MATRKPGRKSWLKLVLYFLLLIFVSGGIAYLLLQLDVPWREYAPTAYLAVFVLSLINSALIGVPLVFAMPAMIDVATEANFVVTVLVASAGGTLGELVAYYAGYLGKRIIHLENTPGYTRLVGWMQRYGPWGVFLIALQPLLPVDIAGLLAGTARLRLWKFLLPCWAGKFPKYLLVAYLGGAIVPLLPPLPFLFR